MEVFAIQYLLPFLIDDFSLRIHNVIIVEDILTNTEVSAFYLLLRRFDNLGQGLTFNRCIFIDIECPHQVFQTVTSKYTHQVIFDRQEEPAFTFITLTTRTTTQLVINSSGFMPFCTQNIQTACFLDRHCFFLDFLTEFAVQFLIFFSGCQYFFIVGIGVTDGFCDDFFRICFLPHFCSCQKFCITAQHNIRTTTSHVGCNGNCTQLTSLCNNFCFLCVILRIQDFVLDTLLLQHCGEQFGFFNGNRTNQYRLSFFVAFNNLFNDGTILCSFCPVNQIVPVNSLNWSVGRDCDNIQLVNFPEFVFFRHGSTSHTGELVIQTEIVLECDCCQSLTLSSYLHMFLRLNCLMQTIIKPSAQHLTTSKFINDDNFAIFYDIVNILPHNTIGFQCLIDVVQQGQVFRCHQVINCKIIFCFLDTTTGNGCSLCLFINDVIGIFIGIFLILLAVHFDNHGRSQSLCELVHNAIQRSGLVPTTRNNQWRSCFINQDGVHFVDDGKVMFPLYLVFLIDNHVISQVVKAQFVVSTISNITGICFTPLVIGQTMQNTANRQAQEPKHLAHFIGLCFCQVVVYGDNMNALARQCIQIGCNAGYQSFTFTGFHFCNSSLMQNDCTNNLYWKRFLAQYTIRCFPDSCQCFCHHGIQCFTAFQPVTEFLCLSL